MAAAATTAPALPNFFAKGWNAGFESRTWALGTPGELREHLDRLVDTGPLLTREAIRLISFEEIYGAGEPVDPAGVIERYAAVTEEALADGYHGLRMSADVTDLVR